MVKWIYNLNTIIISQKSKELWYNYFHEYIDNFIWWNHIKTWNWRTFRTRWRNKRRNWWRLVWKSTWIDTSKTASQCERWRHTITITLRWIRIITKTWPIWQPWYYIIITWELIFCSKCNFRSWNRRKKWIIWLIWDDNWPIRRWRSTNGNRLIWNSRNPTTNWIGYLR